MAIPAVNMTWIGQGPTDTGQVLAQGGNEGNFASTLVGKATIVLDGTLLTSDINYIDGTKQLSFTPSGVMVFRVGGTGLGTILPTSAVDSADSGGSKKVTVLFSAAGTSTQTLTYIFLVLR